MAYLMIFTKADEVNGEEFKKGDTLRVSASIRKTLLGKKTAKDSKKKED